MLKGLYTAYTGMVQEQRRLDTLTNNLANSNTTGYKKEGMTTRSFEEELAIRIKDSGTNYHPRGIGDVTLGVKVGETYTNWEEGAFRDTDKPEDIAIHGNGFFAIEFTDKQGNTSIKYSRDGNFVIDREGYLKTVNGDYVLNQDAAMNGTQGGYIQVNPNLDFTVRRDGSVLQNGQQVAQIGVVDFEDYNYLSKYGENLYDLVDGGQIIQSEATLEQGVLESSNVNIVDEMVSMITIQRAYEAGQRMIRTEDETLEMAVNQVGRV